MVAETDSLAEKIEEFYFLGYNVLKSVESQPMFRSNMSPPSSGPNNKLSKKPA
jgi:hypothetical protein